MVPTTSDDTTATTDQRDYVEARTSLPDRRPRQRSSHMGIPKQQAAGTRQQYNAELQREFLRLREELAEAEYTGAPAIRIRRLRRQIDDNQALFVEANRGLAVSAAKPFLSRSGDHGEDYIADGMVGLLEARLKWNPELGTFATYSREFIRGQIRNGVRRTEFHQMSKGDFDQRPAVLASARSLEMATGHVPSHAEVAQDTKLTEGLVARIREMRVTSLDAPIGDGGATLVDTLEIDTAEVPKVRDSEELLEMCSTLPAREFLVFARYHGLDGAAPQTLNEIGVWTGFGREPARKLNRAAWLRLVAAGHFGRQDLIAAGVLEDDRAPHRTTEVPVPEPSQPSPTRRRRERAFATEGERLF